jgi:hypothetical protein
LFVRHGRRPRLEFQIRSEAPFIGRRCTLNLRQSKAVHFNRASRTATTKPRFIVLRSARIVHTPWDELKAGGAGMSGPACNSSDSDNRPRLPAAFEPVLDIHDQNASPASLARKNDGHAARQISRKACLLTHRSHPTDWAPSIESVDPIADLFRRVAVEKNVGDEQPQRRRVIERLV